MFVRCHCFSPLNQQQPRHYTSQSPSFLAHLFPPKVATPMPCDGDLRLIPSPNVIQSSTVAPWHRFAQDHQIPKEFGMMSSPTLRGETAPCFSKPTSTVNWCFLERPIRVVPLSKIGGKKNKLSCSMWHVRLSDTQHVFENILKRNCINIMHVPYHVDHWKSTQHPTFLQLFIWHCVWPKAQSLLTPCVCQIHGGRDLFGPSFHALAAPHHGGSFRGLKIIPSENKTRSYFIIFPLHWNFGNKILGKKKKLPNLPSSEGFAR